MLNKIKSFFKKVLNKILGKTEDKLVDKAASAVTSKVLSNATKSTNYGNSTPVENIDTTQQNVQAPSEAQMAAMMGASMAGMNESMEMMKYMKFNENMDWIGVTDDAPDAIKMAYLNYQKENAE